MRKYNTFKTFCLLCAFVFAGFGANAQLKNLEQSIYLNFSLPTAQFNDDVSTNALGENIPMTRFNVGKAATAGVGLGYRVSYRFDVGFGEVSPYISGDLHWNRVQSSLRDEYMNAGDGKSPNYLNIPILIGVNYRYHLTEIFSPFGEFGIGSDIMFITKEAGNSTTLGEFKMRYKTSANVGWQIGGGCYFGDHVSASIHYNGFGKHAIQYTDKTEIPQGGGGALVAADASNTGTQSRSIGLLSVKIGFHF